MSETGKLFCGRCDGSNLSVFHNGRLGDLAPPWCREVDYQCRDCGNMVFTYEERGAGPTRYMIVDNGYVRDYDELREEAREHVDCPVCSDPVLDDEDARLIDDFRSEKSAIVHTKCHAAL